jgi:hypothetical protein
MGLEIVVNEPVNRPSTAHDRRKQTGTFGKIFS